MAQKFVSVNYDMNSYLPEDSPSTVALDVMEDEFDGGIPNARVLIYNVTVPEEMDSFYCFLSGRKDKSCNSSL